MNMETGKNNALIFQKTLEHFNVRKRGTILDVGCGDGDLSLELLKMGYYVSATDFVKRIKHPFLQFKQCDLNKQKLPFKNGMFDYIICNMVMEHLQNPGIIIDEMKRVLNKDGEIYITIPNINSLPSKVFFLLTSQLPYYMITKELPKYGDHITIYHPDYFNYLMQFHGFDVMKNDYYSCWIPFTKIRLGDYKQLSNVFNGVYTKHPTKIYTEVIKHGRQLVK